METRSRILIDKVRKDGLVFGEDYTDCDHSMNGFRKVMFRAKEPMKANAIYAIDIETADVLKPSISFSHSKKTRYKTPQYFYHKITNVRLLTSEATEDDMDFLLDL